MKKILICGDSFSADWGLVGWPQLLSEDYNIVNLSQAGVGEYKILKQIQSVDLKNFELIIVSHTSPSRVHTARHPLYREGFHKNCDLIFTDLENKFSFFNRSLKIAQGWFKYHYDDQYQIDIYHLIREKINTLCAIPYISISHADIEYKNYNEKNFIDFFHLWKTHRGSVNHYDDHGNNEIYRILKDKIQTLI